MTNTELAELFLIKLYEQSEESGYGEYSLDLIAKQFGEKDDRKVTNIAEYLHRQGLIKAIFRVGDTSAFITGNGSVFVEQGGATGIIQRYRQSPDSFIIINKSTTIHGNVSNSNVAVHSSNVSQNISVDPEINTILLELIKTLKNDHGISQEQISDAIQDVETLKLQLSKTKKNKSLIHNILSTLSNITSIASHIEKLLELIP